jgi:putative membrane protein
MAHPGAAAACLVALVLYAWGVRRLGLRPGAPVPPVRALCFALGVAAVLAALEGPIGASAGSLFSVHMIQHLLLTLVAAPLLLLGAPLLLARRSAGPGARRLLNRVVRGWAAGALTFPVVSWALFVAVMWGSHYSGLYEAALEHPAIHTLEHALYLGAAFVFWLPVTGMEPSRWRLAYPARLLYLFLAAGQNAFLGASLYQSGSVLYPHYAARGASADAALADQQLGGEAMWILGALASLVAVLLVVAAWMRSEERAARRLEALEDAGGPGARAGPWARRTPGAGGC